MNGIDREMGQRNDQREHDILPEGAGALAGIRVLDLTRVLAGPYCTMLLADMGADVIKVERPGEGDDSRRFPPFVEGQSTYFMDLNRGKRSVALDLKTREGKDAFLQLCRSADVLIENFRAGTMDDLGLGYPNVAAVNPHLIYASISAFGQYGRYKDWSGMDLIAQAIGGLMSVTGWPDSPPTRVGVAVADMLAGLHCAVAILAALRAREVTGRGQYIDVSLADCVVSVMRTVAQTYFGSGKVPGPTGNRNIFTYPHDCFAARDGYVAIAIGNDALWRRLCVCVGREDLSEKPDFATNDSRVKNHQAVRAVVEEWMRARTVKEATDALLEHGVPAAPVLNVAQAVADPNFAVDREMVVEVEGPEGRTYKVIGCPIKMSLTPARVRGRAPLLGEHTAEIVGTAGQR